MSHHHLSDRELLELILLETAANRADLCCILRLLSPRTTHAHIIFGGLTMAAAGTQAVGSTLKASFLPFEADGTTQTPGAKLTTNPTWSVDNTSVATIQDNGDGTATITGVSAGTVTVTATGGVFTDQDGVATAPLDASNQDTVTTGRTTRAQVVFS